MVDSPRAIDIVRYYRRRFGGARPRRDAFKPSDKHELVITGKKGSNGRVLVVRCLCMAEYRTSRRYYNYDPLGEAETLSGALELYTRHREGANDGAQT